jgi:hypothetical protein
VEIEIIDVPIRSVDRTTLIMRNAKQGLAYGEAQTGALRASGTNVASEVSVRPYTSTGDLAPRVRLDAVGVENGQVGYYEWKSSPKARLTLNQKIGYPLIGENGGVVVGNNGNPFYPPGTVLPPKPVTIIRPSTQ